MNEMAKLCTACVCVCVYKSNDVRACKHQATTQPPVWSFIQTYAIQVTERCPPRLWRSFPLRAPPPKNPLKSCANRAGEIAQIQWWCPPHARAPMFCMFYVRPHFFVCECDGNSARAFGFDVTRAFALSGGELSGGRKLVSARPASRRSRVSYKSTSVPWPTVTVAFGAQCERTCLAAAAAEVPNNKPFGSPKRIDTFRQHDNTT